MNDRRDLELVLESGTPLIVIETTDEARVLELLREIALARSASAYRPLFRWSITDGLQRLDLDLEAQRHNAEPEEALRHIRAVAKPGIYALLDFHPFLNEPVHVRLLKDIALAATDTKVTLLLIGHRLDVPHELGGYTARFALRLPDPQRSARDRRALRGRVRQRERPPGQGGQGGARAPHSESRRLDDRGHGAARAQRHSRRRRRHRQRRAGRHEGEVPAPQSRRRAELRVRNHAARRAGGLSQSQALAQATGVGISRGSAARARAAEGDSAARRAGLRQEPRSQRRPRARSVCRCCAWISARSTTSITARRSATCANRCRQPRF